MSIYVQLVDQIHVQVRQVYSYNVDRYTLRHIIGFKSFINRDLARWIRRLTRNLGIPSVAWVRTPLWTRIFHFAILSCSVLLAA